MEKIKVGLFAISKAGHDKGNLYVIVREDEEYVYLADGIHKKLENPKKKKRKHIQIVNKKAIELIANENHIETENLSNNDQIKRAIKLYRLGVKTSL